ncbi:MAG: hypothetical protein DWQ45_05240 [Planctomycetota bacterium]|nr:MAG: hypothetical protein DWQ29_23955 [Planctomycetota bacterium]REK38049.1 MAG: hypothetical protein DWQ45_05240 [Planctomycetota bacterium]
MQLDEQPFGPSADVYVRPHPLLQSPPSGRPPFMDVAVLDARHDAELPLLPVQQQRALNHQQVVRESRSIGDGAISVIVRTAAAGNVLRVIDGVDRPRLSGTGRGRQREIGVTAGFEQHRQLLVNAAQAAVRTGIAQRPVAVNESIDDLSRHRVGAQQSVPIVEGVAKAVQLFGECFGRVVVVMQVHVDISETLRAEFRKCIEIFRPILIFREEERVLRAAAAGVPIPLEQLGVLTNPPVDSLCGDPARRAVTLRLIVVADCDEDVARAVTLAPIDSLFSAANVRDDPVLHVSRSQQKPDADHPRGAARDECGDDPEQGVE